MTTDPINHLAARPSLALAQQPATSAPRADGTTAAGHAAPTQAERPTLTVAEAADLSGVSRWLVQQQINRGALPAIRLGRRIIIPRGRLLAWLEAER